MTYLFPQFIFSVLSMCFTMLLLCIVLIPYSIYVIKQSINIYNAVGNGRLF